MSNHDDGDREHAGGFAKKLTIRQSFELLLLGTVHPKTAAVVVGSAVNIGTASSRASPAGCRFTPAGFAFCSVPYVSPRRHPSQVSGHHLMTFFTSCNYRPMSFS